MDRKLAAILAADIVGYSAQMERDEAGTFARLTERRKDIFEPEIARHGGRIFKTMGDGILAEFGSVVQAVECAVVLQGALEERNRDVPEDQAIHARIGINLGEVIVDGDDRYGEGVNIAARLEQLAEPGGICVSDKVAREVERKLAFGFVLIGAQKVKNIAEPVVVYRVTPDATPRPPKISPTPRSRSRFFKVLLAVPVVAVLFAAILMTWQRQTEEPAAPPAVSFLPLVNETGDTAREYLASGLPEAAALILGSVPELDFVEFVPMKVDPVPVELQRAAGSRRVDLLVIGSLSNSPEGLRFLGNLIDGPTGKSLAELSQTATDGNLARFQFQIAQDALDQIRSARNLSDAAVLDPAWGEVSGSVDEYSLALRAMTEFYSGSDSGIAQAQEILETGLGRYPESILMRIVRAEMFLDEAVYGPYAMRWTSAKNALSLLSEFAEDSDLPAYERWYLHMVRAQVLPLATGDFASAMRDAEAAQALLPRQPGTALRMSKIAANGGFGEQAISWANIGRETGRRPTQLQRQTMGWALLVAGRPEEALAEYELAGDNCLPCELVALVRTARLEEARRLAAFIRKDSPHLTINYMRTYPTGRQPFMAEPYLTEFLNDLRAAGLSEGPPPG